VIGESQMKVIVSGGGTGGHIYPALAIAEGIREKYKEAEILYVGTEGSLEEELANKAGYPFEAIHVKGMPRKLNKKSIIALKELLRGLSDSNIILESFKPDIVIGTGGYVCGPILFRAARRKIPTVIHEQNAFPGITNKILSRFVKKVLITYEDSRKYFARANHVVLTGNPVRKDIIHQDARNARMELNLDEKPTVLSFGGSGGQRSLNESILGIIDQVSRDNEINLIHVTGKPHHESFMKRVRDEKIILGSNVEILPYHHRMPLAIHASDLIITSGGAIALAEISAAGKPSILIPKSYTAENHQEYNARSFQEMGAAQMILEKDLSPGLLYETIMKLMKDREKLMKMASNSKKLGNPEATVSIVEEISKLI
jgi:UDP-N-acetylglucosamine--N-acetylmuramyl-(pentapeptide) pyrophosphoryl-undecaprenol N-acetylglucosamine transferase